ncbi:hypothetical protein [Flavobacterium palustre]|uniref:hypothetical protein n=1 Tax=Flavobacterium palustre TaxID=1476463 RepID=UPI00361558FA
MALYDKRKVTGITGCNEEREDAKMKLEAVTVDLVTAGSNNRAKRTIILKEKKPIRNL